MLSKALELGSCGVQWRPPDGAIAVHTATELALTDDNGLRWRIQHLPAEFAIAPGEETALSEDLYLSARAAFEARWRQRPRTPDAQPRTASGEWSPIIEAKVGAVGTGRIARVVYHVAREPGDEAVVGQLLVPVEKGTVAIRVLAVDADPLSRLRAALEGVLGAMEIVTLPERPIEMALPEPGCAVAAPMRFVLAPAVAGSGRGELVRLGVDDWKRTIEVARFGRHALKGKDMRTALVEHANKTADSWQSEGVSGIRSISKPIDDFGVCMQVQHYAMFVRDGEARHAVYRWWLAGDGTLWRIGETATATVDRQMLADDVAAVQDSFRRI